MIAIQMALAGEKLDGRVVTIKDYLVQNHPLPNLYKQQALTGNWKPHQECHIQPDFLLIWDTDIKVNKLILVRCGSHADLFG